MSQMNGYARAPLQLLDPRLEHLFALRTPLTKALRGAGDTHTISDLATGILNGGFQYWQALNAGVITEIVTYPRKRVLSVFLAFGDLDGVMGLQPRIEAFGVANGCSAMIECGRAGWEKVLPKYGWVKRWALFSLDLHRAKEPVT